MPTGPTPSILMARATGLAARAAGMTLAATSPEMRDALRAIELIAREANFWLQEQPAPDVLREIEAGLATQAKRLDTLEDRLRLGADAKP